jgi:hypothetical protein
MTRDSRTGTPERCARGGGAASAGRAGRHCRHAHERLTGSTNADAGPVPATYVGSRHSGDARQLPQRSDRARGGDIASPDLDQLATAQQALTDLGVTVADLQTQGGSSAPTFGEYLPIVVAAAGSGASRTYGPYLARMATAWADRRLD